MTVALRRGLAAVLLWAALPAPSVHAQTAEAPFHPPDDVRFERKEIVSEGTRMRAEVFFPQSAKDGEKLPTLILCHGWGGTARDLRPEGIAFARAGYLVAVFDYRGWGESDARVVLTGPAPSEKKGGKFTAEVKEVREVVDPLDQTTDLLNAIHWVQGEPRCDTKRIGLWGSSYSGGHVAYAAARDHRVKAIVCQVAAFDSRWVLMNPVMAAQTFNEATRRARGEIGYPEPGARVVQGLRGAPIRERMMNYAPVEDIDKAAPDCAMLFLLAEKEEYFDNRDHGIKAHARARGPKKLVTIPGIKHYGIYNEGRPEAQKLAIAWFDEHLKAKGAAAKPSGEHARSKDWPMYNRDVRGWRLNPGETALAPSNVGGLVEKWRFPAKDAKDQVGVIHATPIVVDGEVYFGTASDPAFYKLNPDGTLAWTYRNPDRGFLSKLAAASPNSRFSASGEGILASALVEGDTVYFGDIGGRFYALDRRTGKERWKLNARGKEFPDAHAMNTFFASPILADGKIIVGGGALEQLVAGTPFYRGSTGRGFVAALDPKDGRVLWKYDVGPRPEKLDPPITMKEDWGDHTFYYGPATSSVWSTPSFDAESGTLFFGTDVNTAPRKPTADDPRLHTPESCAVIALDVRDGKSRWVTQISPGDVWTNSMRSYDPKEGRYKDQSIGDTPKIYTIVAAGTPMKVVGVGCKNGGFYVLRASDGKVLDHTPIYTGPPSYPLSPEPDGRMLALPSCIGGLQSGCATDGASIFTNGIDCLRMGSQKLPAESGVPPTGGRVVSLSLDTKSERWRHERPKIAAIGGPPPKPAYADVGDPVASGIAVANGVLYFTAVASGKLVALDASSGGLLKEIALGPVWSGPSLSRGRVYIGTGNTLFNAADFESYLPKKSTGTLYSFGLPGEDEVDRLPSAKKE